jgi:hypothetical protein
VDEYATGDRARFPETLNRIMKAGLSSPGPTSICVCWRRTTVPTSGRNRRTTDVSGERLAQVRPGLRKGQEALLLGQAGCFEGHRPASADQLHGLLVHLVYGGHQQRQWGSLSVARRYEGCGQAAT